MNNEARACGFALGAVLLWSTVATAFKLSLAHMQPVQLLAYASLVSVLTLAVVLQVRGQFRAVFHGSVRDYGRSVLLGLMNPFLYYMLLFEAFDRLPAQEAQPLNYTWAFTLALLAIPLLGQRPGLRDLVAGLVAYAGVWVIATRGDVLSLEFASPSGVLLALASTLCWAFYWIYSARDPRDPLVALFVNFTLGLPFILLYCGLTSGFSVAGWEALAGAAYVGVFEMGLAFVLWLYAMRLSNNASRIGNLIFLSPFLSLVFIHFILGEVILPSTYTGLALIVTGLVLQQLRGRHITEKPY